MRCNVKNGNGGEKHFAVIDKITRQLIFYGIISILSHAKLLIAINSTHLKSTTKKIDREQDRKRDTREKDRKGDRNKDSKREMEKKRKIRG